MTMALTPGRQLGSEAYHDTHQVIIDVVGPDGQSTAEAALDSREAIVTVAAVTGAEDKLSQRFDPEGVRAAYLETYDLTGRAVTRSVLGATREAAQLDEAVLQDMALRYVTTIRGTVPDHSFLDAGQPADGSQEDDAADDAVKMSPEDLFGDDEDDEAMGPAVDVAAVVGDVAKDVEHHTTISLEEQRILAADAEAAERRVPVSVDSIRIAAAGLALQARQTDNPALRKELLALKAKFDQMAGGTIMERVRSASKLRARWFAGAVGLSRVVAAASLLRRF